MPHIKNFDDYLRKDSCQQMRATIGSRGITEKDLERGERGKKNKDRRKRNIFWKCSGKIREEIKGQRKRKLFHGA